MAKNKKTKHWSKKKINNKLFSAIVIIFILLGISTVYLYSIPAIGLPLESQIEYNFQNLLLSWTNQPPKIHVPQPITRIPGYPAYPSTTVCVHCGGHPEMRVTTSSHWVPCGQLRNGCSEAYNQGLTPTPTPIEQLPNKNFNWLEIYQEGPPPNSSYRAITKRITDLAEVSKLYVDIQNLPFWPEGATYNCGLEQVNGYIYKLKFFTNTGFFVYAELDPNGCPGVTFAGEYKPRMAMNPQGNKLIDDLQQAMNISPQEFYRY